MQRGAAVSPSIGSGSTDRTFRPTTRTAEPTSAPGLEYERFFTREGIDPVRRSRMGRRARPSSATRRAQVVFEQRDVEIPRFWSQQATNIVVSKYFRGSDRHARARAQRQAAHRPRRRHDYRLGEQAEVLRQRGRSAGVQRRSEAPARLSEGGVQQPGLVQRRVREGTRSARRASSTPCRTRWSRSSAWRRPRGCSSSTARAPARTCRHIRSSRELLAGGGTASGPVSFMKGFDAFAGVIKSGGKTRRAAKMVILNAEHPDIVEFINCKVEEEKKAWALIDAGYDGSFTGPAYASVFFQNSNNSVRVTDEFMRAVMDDGEWHTRAVLDRRGDGHLQGPRPDAADRRGDAHLRRSRAAVRHHRQRLAHLPEHGADQRQQSVLGIHVPGRFGVQPGVDQPDEVRPRGRRVRPRRRSTPRAAP